MAGNGNPEAEVAKAMTKFEEKKYEEKTPVKDKGEEGSTFDERSRKHRENVEAHNKAKTELGNVIKALDAKFDDEKVKLVFGVIDRVERVEDAKDEKEKTQSTDLKSAIKALLKEKEIDSEVHLE